MLKQYFLRINNATAIIIFIACLTTPIYAQDLTQGTIGPIYSNRDKLLDAGQEKFNNINIVPGESYYSVRIVGAMISVPPKNMFEGLFKKASQVTMTSSAKVDGFDPVQGINWVEPIGPGKQVSLGARPFVANYIPAQGVSLGVSVEYRVLRSLTLYSRQIM